mgnify:FL=1
MPKRRANGEGNIRKRKDGRWEGRYTAGYDANGKVITKNVLGRTQAEVKDKLRTAIEDSWKLDPVKAGSYTFEQWLKLWYSVYVEPQVRYSTKEFYHSAIDHHIIPKLGGVKLEKLTMLQIQQFYNELLKSGRVQKKNQPELKEHGLSPRMVQCVHVVLNKALEHAVEEKLILANPAKKCKIPKNTRKEMKILPEALIGPYLSAAKEHGILAPMYLELTTGLRRGELLALRWEDLDVQNRTLSINKSVARQDGKLVISTPKTPNSIRTVLLPEDTVKLLVEEHERHPANPYLFPSPRTGETWDPDGFRRLHDRIIKEIGAEHVRFHDMRHPYVKHTTKIFSLRLMDFQAQAYPDARRKTRGACQLHRGGQSQSPVRPLCNRKRFSCLPPQSKMSWILYAISMRLSGYTSTRSISSSASSVVSVSASKIALDASLRLSCRACSSCFCFACANTAA